MEFTDIALRGGASLGSNVGKQLDGVDNSGTQHGGKGHQQVL